MPDFEREKYRLGQSEREPSKTRLAIILEDNRYIVQLWLEAFDEVPNIRCVVPELMRGYSKGFLETTKPEQTVLVIADRFVDNVFMHVETADFLDWLKAGNPNVFVVETSILSFSNRKYKGANVVMRSFPEDLVPVIRAVRGTEQNTWMAKIYALQMMAVPELLKAKKLDNLNEDDITQNELFEEFFRLMDNSQYHEMISRIEVDYDEVACLFGKFDPKSALVFLHCAYSIIGHLNLRHDETYFAMAISRIKTLLEDVRRSGPSV